MKSLKDLVRQRLVDDWGSHRRAVQWIEKLEQEHMAMLSENYGVCRCKFCNHWTYTRNGLCSKCQGERGRQA
jgi:hypothetical protein